MGDTMNAITAQNEGETNKTSSAAPKYEAPKVLENNRIRLELFDNDKHMPMHYEVGRKHPDVMQWMMSEDLKEYDEVIKYFDDLYGKGARFYAVMNKAGNGEQQGDAIAGIVGFDISGLDGGCSEVGVQTYPEYRRTHVTTNALGLLIHYLLDPPPTGLGLRRVQWTADELNTASISTSKRLGFTLEGIKRWSHILPRNRAGNGRDLEPLAKRNGVSQAPGRHSAILSLCWEEWEGKREKLDAQMAR